jgi:hypothetical protein
VRGAEKGSDEHPQDLSLGALMDGRFQHWHDSSAGLANAYYLPFWMAWSGPLG